MIFTPFYLPLVGIALLLTFSFIKEAPTDYKLMLLAIVYILTVFMPTILIFIYRLFRGWSLQELGKKHHRIVPYAISIACYLGCIWVMYYLHVVYLVIDIIIAALLIQAISVIVNFFWKISTHAAAIGGVSGALVGFGFDPMLHFYPLLWLCLSILVAADSFLSARMGKGPRRKRKKTAPPAPSASPALAGPASPADAAPAAGQGGQA